MICSPLPIRTWNLTIHPLRNPASERGISQFIPFGTQHPRATRSLLQSMWDPPIHPFGDSVVAGTPPHVHSLWSSVSRSCFLNRAAS